MSNPRPLDPSTAQLLKTHGYSVRADYHRDTEANHRAQALAVEILRLARSTLLLHFRFLEQALVRFVPGQEAVTAELATDGHFLYYNSLHVCRCFYRNAAQTARDYLHLTLHCVFQHLFVGEGIDRALWDLACDIAVENQINGFSLAALECPRQEKQQWLIRKLAAQLPGMNAEQIYRALREQALPPGELARLRQYFYADDHAIWYRQAEQTEGQGDANRRSSAAQDQELTPQPGELDNGTAELSAPEDAGDEAQQSQQASGGQSTGETKPDGDSTGAKASERPPDRQGEKGLSPEQIRQQWKQIGERIRVELETMGGSWGESAGSLIAALRALHRERCDYAAFLKRFAVLGENIQINDDEFDYIFYTYGMKLYGRMPLIEPLEYKEVQRVREFVIALDTSESVEGELVQSFVTKTWNILKQTDNFFTKVNIHILQCGARVEEDVKITSQEEFDAYIRRMQLRGFGGTDFRPVFARVDEMIRQHEFSNLKGLLYFTDGYGTFPAMPPGYEAAFVFLEQEREIPDVPPWAIRIQLRADEIRQLE